MVLPDEHAAIHAARALGHASAVAAQGQRDLQAYASAAPDVFPPRPFDATLFGMVCLANAVSAPARSAAQLIVANRAALFGFAVDWQVDYVMTARADVQRLVGACLSTADGGTAHGPLLGLLADVRDRLHAVTGLGDLAGTWMPVWREELRRMIVGMAREWDWRASGTLPTLAGYLDNADNLGSAWVNLSHWLFTRDGDHEPAVDLVLAAIRDQQVVIRLLNDLGTHRRDQEWGDVNALMLGVDAEAVSERVAEQLRRCQFTFAPLRTDEPMLVEFLERQIGFCAGFYGITDYWGEL